MVSRIILDYHSYWEMHTSVSYFEEMKDQPVYLEVWTSYWMMVSHLEAIQGEPVYMVICISCLEDIQDGSDYMCAARQILSFYELQASL
jgi:hypothetical protein